MKHQLSISNKKRRWRRTMLPSSRQSTLRMWRAQKAPGCHGVGLQKRRVVRISWRRWWLLEQSFVDATQNFQQPQRSHGLNIRNASILWRVGERKKAGGDWKHRGWGWRLVQVPGILACTGCSHSYHQSCDSKHHSSWSQRWCSQQGCPQQHQEGTQKQK